MLTPLLTYLVQIIKFQRALIIFLLAQLIDIFDHSRLPSTDKPTYKRFNQFQVDDKLPILAADIGPESLNYEQLIIDYMTKTGKDLKPIRRRQGTVITFQNQRCPRC
ncbi:transposase, partial [Lactiplantibacillus plantarum]